jgi:hypothetical protein
MEKINVKRANLHRDFGGIVAFFLQQYRQNRIIYISLIHKLKLMVIDFIVPLTCIIRKQLDGIRIGGESNIK